MHYELIETQKAFDLAIEIIKKSKIIGLDTEFLRVNTYFPLLSLIQISTENDEFFIFDIHSKNIDWLNLITILCNSDVIKIIHSAEQDLEAIEYRFNAKMLNIIDTQIMAEFLDLDKQCGYGTLVEHFFGIQIDKQKQFSAWHKRPLSQKQLDYAAIDVVYLIKLYKLMIEKLEQKKFDINILKNKSASISYKTKNIDKFNIARLIKVFCNKYRILLGDKELVFNLIKLREELAIKHNKARKYILDDSEIIKIIKQKNISFNNFSKYINTETISNLIKNEI